MRFHLGRVHPKTKWITSSYHKREIPWLLQTLHEEFALEMASSSSASNECRRRQRIHELLDKNIQTQDDIQSICKNLVSSQDHSNLFSTTFSQHFNLDHRSPDIAEQLEFKEDVKEMAHSTTYPYLRKLVRDCCAEVPDQSTRILKLSLYLSLEELDLSCDFGRFVRLTAPDIFQYLTENVEVRELLLNYCTRFKSKAYDILNNYIPPSSGTS